MMYIMAFGVVIPEAILVHHQSQPVISTTCASKGTVFPAHEATTK